jgi:hypothetical protein
MSSTTAYAILFGVMALIVLVVVGLYRLGSDESPLPNSSNNIPVQSSDSNSTQKEVKLNCSIACANRNVVVVNGDSFNYGGKDTDICFMIDVAYIDYTLAPEGQRIYFYPDKSLVIPANTTTEYPLSSFVCHAGVPLDLSRYRIEDISIGVQADTWWASSQITYN